MKINIKTIAAMVIVLFLIATVAIYYVYNKPHRDISKETPVAILSSDALFAAFEQDESAANALYLDKVIQVKGIVDEITLNNAGMVNLILRAESAMFGGVNVTLNEKYTFENTSVLPGDLIELKCRCTGMTMDIVLVDCLKING